jgi:hypothetical protein
MGTNAGILSSQAARLMIRSELLVDGGCNIFIIGIATFLSSKEVIPEVHEELGCKIEGRS